jgi:hypothetical protein
MLSYVENGVTNSGSDPRSTSCIFHVRYVLTLLMIPPLMKIFVQSDCQPEIHKYSVAINNHSTTVRLQSAIRQHEKLTVICTIVRYIIVLQWSWVGKEVEMTNEIFSDRGCHRYCCFGSDGAGTSRTRNDTGESYLYLQRVYWALFD